MSTAPVPEFATLPELVDYYIAAYQIPGAAVGLMVDGEITTTGHGVISLATHYPTRPDSLFQIGSNSKVFTATVLMTLVDEGKLELDAPINTYLPDLTLADPTAAGTITTRQLLSHTSGLEGDRFDPTTVGEDALQLYVAGAGDWAQETAAGQFWSYCNSGFGLAGRLIEVLAGQPFETVMQERIFTPLGLTRSFYFAEDAIVYSAAAGHNQGPTDLAPQVALPYLVGRYANPAGGIIASTRDLLTFIKFHLGDGTWNGERILSDASRQAMQQPQATITPGKDWGIGWSLEPWGDLAAISHGGGTNGHISQAIAIPDRSFALVVYTNSSRGAKLIEQVETWAFKHYLGAEKTERPHVTLTPEQQARLTGVFSRKVARAAVSQGEAGLVLDVTVFSLGDREINYPTTPLVALSENELLITEGDLAGNELVFIAGDDGVPRFMRLGGRLTARQADAA